MHFSLLAIVLWGTVGLLQKLGTNRISAPSLLVWVTVGFVILLPFFMREPNLWVMSKRGVFIGTLAGVLNGMGAWFLFASLETGAKASVAVPLTALYPLVTVLLATVFLAETLTGLQWVGVLLALLSGAMLSYEVPNSTPKSDN
jgi:transporter family protein